jgi:hypothetical protein
MHEDPIPSVDHLFGYLSIAGFIRIPEVPSPQIDKIDNEAES